MSAEVELRWVPTLEERMAVHRRAAPWRWWSALVTAAGVGTAGAWMALDDVPWAARAAAAVGGGVAAGAVLWNAPAHRLRREGPSSEVRLVLGPRGLVHEQGGVRSERPWAAVRSIAPVPEGWMLDVDGHPLLVPARGVPEGLMGRASSWRQGEVDPAPKEAPPPGHDEVVVGFVATLADYVDFVRGVEARRRPVWVAPLAAFLLVGAALAAERVTDLRVLLALCAWGAVLVVSGGLRRSVGRWTVGLRVRSALARDPGRLPSGPVTVGLGPEGGWVGSSRGVTRFDWREVLAVERREDSLVVLFGDTLGLVLPGRAVGDVASLAERVEAWRGRRPAPEGPRRSRDELPGPFTPPGW